MSNPDLQVLKLDVRAMLQSAGMNGLTLEEVERDFKDLCQRPIPYAQFGMSSVHELLASMPDIVLIMPAREGVNPTLYYAMPDPATRHLERLIENQRVRAPTRFGGAISNEIASGDRPLPSTNQPAMPNRNTSAAAQAPATTTQGYQVGPGFASVIRQNVGQRLQNAGRGSSIPQQTVVSQNPPPGFPKAAFHSAPIAQTSPIDKRSAENGPQTVIDRPPRSIREAHDILQKLKEASIAASTSANGPPLRAPNVPSADAASPAIPIVQPVPLRQPAPIRHPSAPPTRSGPPPGTIAAIVANSCLNKIGQRPSAFGPPPPLAAAATATGKMSPTSSFATEIERELESPETVGGATASVAPSRLRQRHDSGSSISAITIATTRGPIFPEEAPIIIPSSLPVGVKMPHPLWKVIYEILREQGAKWLDIRQFQTEYARRMKKPLSAEYLLKHCGIRSYKQLFVDLPHIEVLHSPDEVMYVRLTTTLSRKNVSVYDVKPRYHSVRPQTHGGVQLSDEMVDALDSEENLLIPCPPTEPPASSIPQDVRVQIYHLLWNQFRNGTDISTFSEAFTKRYGASLNTTRDCGMSLDMTLHYMGDLVDTGKAADGKLWLRPVPYEDVRAYYKEQRREIKERRKHGLAVSTKK